MEKKWHIREVDNTIVEKLTKETGENPLLLKVLVGRGITEPKEIIDFLYPKLENLHSPFLLKNIESAVERVETAIKNKDKILIWGDEDTDGSSAVVCLKKGFELLGINVNYYIPSRKIEGIGLTKEGIKKAKEQGINLIITADCGSQNKEQVLFAQKIGIDCIITDHHEVIEEFPFLINPKLGNYPFPELAGVSVAYKFLQAILTRANKSIPCEEFFPLLLFGSVSDRVPLIGENRIFCKFGLEFVQKTKNLGIRSLGTIETVDDVIKKVIPILSAGKPRGGKYNGCELLLSTNSSEIRRIIRRLSEEGQMWERDAREFYKNFSYKCKDTGIIFLVDSSIPSNFTGYLASRLKDRYDKPAIVIGEKGQGEGRSPEYFNLFEALLYCSSALKSFGGHRKAAGFYLKDTDSFIQKFLEYSKGKIQEVEPHIDIDAYLPPEEVTPEIIKDLNKLAPFGSNNTKPIFLAKGVKLEKRNKEFFFSEGRAVEFPNKPAAYETLSGEPIELDILYSIKEDGNIIIRDTRPSKFNI